MNTKKLLILNRISGGSFLVSSLCLLVIPFLDISNGMTLLAYITASVFWAGLLAGVIMQLCLYVKCKKISRKKASKKLWLLYAGSVSALLLLIIVTALNFKNIFIVSLLLFISIVFLESAVVVKKERCLK